MCATEAEENEIHFIIAKTELHKNTQLQSFLGVMHIVFQSVLEYISIYLITFFFLQHPMTCQQVKESELHSQVRSCWNLREPSHRTCTSPG